MTTSQILHHMERERKSLGRQQRRFLHKAMRLVIATGILAAIWNLAN